MHLEQYRTNIRIARNEMQLVIRVYVISVQQNIQKKKENKKNEAIH